MTHKARGGSSSSGRSYESYAADPAITIGMCEPCDKHIFLSRKTARRVARQLTEHGRPRAYRCHANPQQWHVGHIPVAVRWGNLTRDEWDEHRGLT